MIKSWKMYCLFSLFFRICSYILEAQDINEKSSVYFIQALEPFFLGILEKFLIKMHIFVGIFG